MRRSVLAAAVVAALLAAAPAGAASRRPSTGGRVADATGDWPVASQDLVSAQVTSSRAGGQAVLRAVLTLAEAPDAVAEYTVSLDSDCDVWTLSVRGKDARLQRSTCALTELPETAPATVQVSGKQIVVTAPYALGLAKGMRFGSLTATASPYLTGVVFGSSVSPTTFVVTGDVASGSVAMTLA